MLGNDDMLQYLPRSSSAGRVKEPFTASSLYSHGPFGIEAPQDLSHPQKLANEARDSTTYILGPLPFHN
uniref:Uncharacterized protein n=1 Tax=Oryza punctata TaxID=4537 RepID=A0A0E0M886_ORYPU